MSRNKRNFLNTCLLSRECLTHFFKILRKNTKYFLLNELLGYICHASCVVLDLKFSHTPNKSEVKYDYQKSNGFSDVTDSATDSQVTG
jgi:hypothetical protein